MGELGRVVVVAEHRPSKTPPIQIQPGDTLDVGKRDDEWPAFVQVSTASGGSGWVPSRFLSADQGTAVVNAPYYTKELAGLPGDVLSVLERDDEGGWSWCRNAAGDEGWIPTRALGPLSKEDRSRVAPADLSRSERRPDAPGRGAAARSRGQSRTSR